MSLVFSLVHTVPYSNKPVVKDVIAKLHSYITYNLLIGFAVIISFKQFGGRPIECMLPAGFNGAWEQYAENICWAQDTYFVPPDVFVENVSEVYRRERKISYYQWMPFFLLFQAACFKIPTFLWKYFAGQSGMKVGEILRLATDHSNAVVEVKKANIDTLCVHLCGALRFQKRLKKKRIIPHKVLRFLNLKYSSFYVATIYMLSKIAFLINVCFQIHLLNSYLLPQFKDDFGISALKTLIFPPENESSWHISGIFPRVSLCDFEVREMGNLQTHTVQCVLVVNIFTEKIFVLLWTWFVILSAVTVISLINWIYLLASKCSKERFILSHLEMCEIPFDKNTEENKMNVDRFIMKYLGHDGVFILRMIAQFADVVFSTELIGALWRSHCAIEHERRALKMVDRVWPQHEQRLKAALFEEELAADTADDYKGSVTHLRRKSIPFLQSNTSSSFSPRVADSDSTLRDMIGKANINLNRKESIFSLGQISPPPALSLKHGGLVRTNSSRLRRRRSLEDLRSLSLKRVKKFADSSSDEDENTKKSTASRKGSIFKLS